MHSSTNAYKASFFILYFISRMPCFSYVIYMDVLFQNAYLFYHSAVDSAINHINR